MHLNTLIQRGFRILSRKHPFRADTPIVTALSCCCTGGKNGQPRAINSAVGDGHSGSVGYGTIKVSQEISVG